MVARATLTVAATAGESHRRKRPRCQRASARIPRAAKTARVTMAITSALVDTTCAVAVSGRPHNLAMARWLAAPVSSVVTSTANAAGQIHRISIERRVGPGADTTRAFPRTQRTRVPTP